MMGIDLPFSRTAKVYHQAFSKEQPFCGGHRVQLLEKIFHKPGNLSLEPPSEGKGAFSESMRFLKPDFHSMHFACR